MKEDEKRFLIDVYNDGKKEQRLIFGYLPVECNVKTPRDIIGRDDFYMHYKRAWYLLDKWCNKGWYDYGTTLDLGWLTDEGVEKAKELQEG